ncbi:toll/interleukin-1 receptor domain-containing protein [Rhodobacteraceae bacterium R_SAG3]|nr:toll/interleukin-1 receptor domain-containing protein [Rhodobacteraceae bacterium R_SAG3]
MAPSKIPTKIFLSHAAADGPLIEAFETLLAKSLGITSAEIFCSSLEGQGVTKGGNFVDEIRARAAEAEGVVALISPAYLDSPFCMAELGAAWVLKTQRLPIIVPPNSFKEMQATLLGIVGVRIDDEDALAQGFEDFSDATGIPLPASAVRSRAAREFKRKWATLKNDIPPPSRVAAAVHSATIQERNDAVEARDSAEELLSKAEAKMSALRKAKDAAAVSDIDAEFDESDWQERLDDELSAIRELYVEVGGREIVRLLILECLGKEVRPDFQYYSDEAKRAVELDVYDDEAKKWNHAHPEVAELGRRIENIQEIFIEFPEATTELKSRGMKSNPDSIRFWEEHL